MAVIDVACAIISVDEKILVVQRSATMSQPLKWEFPGGKIEAGESDIDCVKREIKEELNLEIELVNRLSPSQYSYPQITINLIPFTAIVLSGDILLKEHAQFKILDREQLSMLDWAAADLPILNEFLKYE